MGFGVQGLRFRVRDFEFRFQGSWFRVEGPQSQFRVQGVELLEIRTWGLAGRVLGVWGLGYGVWGLGFSVYKIGFRT